MTVRPQPATGVNPHAPQPVSPISMVRTIWANRQLILQMTRRDAVGRYRGSLLGLAWSFFNPVLMLIVYTFVFSVVFKARWATGGEETKMQFAVILFSGLIVHSLFGEVVNRAPSVVLGNVNYVKKVVFPLEVLPVVAVGSALFHTMASVLVLVLAYVTFNGLPPWTIVFTPVVLSPVVILSLGLAWILAALGVFVRDISQTTGIVTTVLLFLSPVFFPMSALPTEFHALFLANPLTFIIEQTREVLIWGRLPDWTGLALYTLAATIVAWIGFVWFQKTRKGFADVL